MNNKEILKYMTENNVDSIELSVKDAREIEYEDRETVYTYTFAKPLIIKIKVVISESGLSCLDFVSAIPSFGILVFGSSFESVLEKIKDMFHRQYQDLTLADPKTLDNRAQLLAKKLRSVVKSFEAKNKKENS